MELWVIDGQSPPRKVQIDLELGGDQLRDVEGRELTRTTHFQTRSGALTEQARQRHLERSAPAPLRGEWSVVLLEPDVKLRSQIAALLEERGFQVAAIDTERAAMDHLRGPNPPGCLVVDRTALSGPGPALAADLSRRRFGQTWMVFIESTPDPTGGQRLCEPAEALVSAVHLACSHHENATHTAQPSR